MLEPNEITVSNLPPDWPDVGPALSGKPALQLTKKVQYESYTLTDMANLDFKVDYIVDGVLAENQPMIIGGKSKTLKSSVVLDLAISISTGEPFLNYYRVSKPQNVVFMSAESGMATIKEKARANMRSRGLDFTGDELAISPDVVKITEMPHMDAVEKILAKHDSKILIIDPTYLSLPADAMSNVFAQGENLCDFAMFCQSLRVTLILVHHAKKTIMGYDPLELDAFAGAGFAEFARQWILINRREPMDMNEGIHRLWLTFGGSAGHFGGWGADVYEGVYQQDTDWRQWDIKLHFMSDCRQAVAEQQTAIRNQERMERLEADIEVKETEIMALLTKGPLVKKDIQAAVGRSKAVENALGKLEDEKRIKKCEIKKGNNRRYEGYDLA